MCNSYPRPMPLTFTLDPAVTPALRDGVLDLWTDVSDAGGAVGFVAPVTREEIRPELVKHLAAMAEGPPPPAGGPEGGREGARARFFSFNTHRLMRHWVWLYT